ncbi:HAMP domain-containing sensor histidine kinase [Mogibacterium neglectum]|uniref:sensor histidine kinase n=1 Tax=Mogibacterium neglectum TaxID=114528 RepID=UPI00272B5EB1|nr:HAMP domain-containing sensor histidine kinase [Mogibacterium neglectum]WLD76555.1 HAMP domain-containing sensor histidine kinase [Mogibacterium neglectum]
MKTKKSKWDPNSIRAVSLMYFMVFAAVILLMVWFMQSFFMNTYYERMMAQEAQTTANKLGNYYSTNKDNFDAYARQAADRNGLYIRLETADLTSEYGNSGLSQGDLPHYQFEISDAKDKLAKSSLGKISLTVTEKGNKASHLVYATYLGNRDDGNILYMIAPLYPVESTISILRSQLLYITFITLMIASMLAIIMSTWLSLPIASITKSAVQLSNGNYNVNFNGGIFTETNELARTLNKASYEMQKTDSYQRDLIANVSHDLKTPLTMIKSYAEMINDISGDNPEKRAEHLAVIIAEADRLNKLVSDMLSASRLQSNSAELNMTKFDIVKAATEVEETFEVLNQQEGYNISFNKCKTAYVYGDYDKLKQVMANLISNAIKYCGKDKYVRIELKKVGRNVRFDVIDHGDGIAAEEISHVWERYYRTSANRNRNIEGTGLGLSIVKGILSLHNANYGVESEEGKGSDFWFELATVKK